MTSSAKTVFAEEFSIHYEFYKEYDDVVIHKDNKQIFKANFKDGMVQLVPLSNDTAIQKIELGLSEFAKELKKQG
ncbi:MAG: hypothetical protein L3J44_04170, partial [Campylobacteraceae bacterium]|nr:hypothetical protein [Campylobacteraceae bacterium]